MSLDYPGSSWTFNGTNVTLTTDHSRSVGFVGAMSVSQNTLVSCTDTVFLIKQTRLTFTNPGRPSDSYDWGPGEGGGRTGWDVYANSYKVNGTSATINDLFWSR
ncbi:hypothetical protein D3C71_1908790 [compost metagenome]